MSACDVRLGLPELPLRSNVVTNVVGHRTLGQRTSGVRQTLRVSQTPSSTHWELSCLLRGKEPACETCGDLAKLRLSHELSQGS